MALKTLLIAGGSASGKSWLAERVARLRPNATHLSQDSFYHDRPSGSAADRHDFDFDQPYAIDWAEMRAALEQLKAGQPTDIPLYDFSVSLRAGSERIAPNGDVLIVDGTLVLSRSKLVEMADACVFVRASEALRRQRREKRDVEERGREIEFVRHQLETQVFPAHDEHVEPSAAHADLVLDAPDIIAKPDQAVRRVLELLDRTG